MISRSFIAGFIASAAILIFYFLVVSAISGWDFARAQFLSFRYYFTLLAAGFGIQAGLYFYLRSSIRAQATSGGVVAISGATSGAAMISCCAHYFVNILPILGISGFVTLVSQYQIELFWLGLLFNAGGIMYLRTKIAKFQKT